MTSWEDVSDRVLPHHVEYLSARAVTPGGAKAAGLHSADAEQVAELLGLPGVTSGGLVIPYPHIDPKYVRVRMDRSDGRAKFLAPQGRGAPVYDAVTATGAEADGPLVICEGPVKALALVSAGIRAAGLGGAETGLDKERKLDHSFSFLEFRSREVLLLPDADIVDNYGVMRGQARLAAAILRGGTDLAVRLARLPGPGKQGPDDFLADHGAERLGEVIAGARPVRPREFAANLGDIGKEERTSEITRLLDDKFFFVSLIVWGEPEIQVVRHLFKGATAGFDAVLAATRAALVGASRRADQTNHAESGPYAERDGRLWFMRRVGTRYGEEAIPEQLTNFTAQIVKETSLDDGVEPQRLLTLRVTLDNGTDLGEHDVPAAQFGSGRTWLVQHFGSDAVILGNPNAVAHTCAAVALLSPAKELVHAFAHLGFREVVDASGQLRLVYLHADGAIGGEGVTVFVDAALSHYGLPSGTEDVRGAVLVSMRLLDVAVDRVSVPLFCSTYLPPLRHWVPIEFATWCWGPTGVFKTAVASVCQSHYGDFEGHPLPGSWLSTPASLEHLLSRAKDALATIDDFVPRSTHELDETRRKGSQVMRSIGNNAARGRMRQDLTARPDRPPRAFVIVTGEDVLSGESATARTFGVRFEKGFVNLSVLTELQHDARRLPHAMRGYIEYLISIDTWLKTNAKARVTKLRAEFAGNNLHARQPDACARLMFAAEVFARFATSVGALDEAGAAVFFARIRAGLGEASTEHATGAQERKPVTRFLHMLGSLIAQGKVVVGDDTNSDPGNVLAGATFVGWRDAERMLLLPEPTFRAVCSAMRDAGDLFPLTQETLWLALRTAGLLAGCDAGRNTTRTRAVAGRPRVVALWSRALDEPEGPDSPVEPPDGPAGPTGPRNDAARGATPTPRGDGAFPEVAPMAPAGESRVGSFVGIGPQPITPLALGAELPVSASPASGANGPSIESRCDINGLGVPLPVPSDGPSGVSPGVDAGSYFTLVTDPAQLACVAAAVSAADTVAVDTETTGLDALKDRVRLVQLGLPDGRIYVIDVWATNGLGPVAEVLCRVPWVGHNLHFDVGMMRQLGVRPLKLLDTMLAAQVLDSGVHLGAKGHFTLAALLERHLRVELSKEQQRSDWSALQLTPQQLAYAARDVQHLHALFDVLSRALAESELGPTADLEFAALPAVVDMALAGVCFDRRRWAELTEQKRCEAAEARAFVERELGIANAASATNQLLPALQRRLGVPLTKTDREALAPYVSDPVVGALQKFRACSSFTKTHGEPFLAAMAKHPDGRVRGDWRQIGTTGRMSCSAPPLLNLPKSVEVRSCIVAPPGHVLIAADYAQISFRIAAQVVGDERLLEVFRSGGDPHSTTAALIAGIPVADVTPAQRAKAKPPNFGFLFGMGAPRFVDYALKDYGVVFSLDEARKFKDGYLRAYPGIARWQRLIGDTAPTEMRTVGGRIRAFPNRNEGYSHRLNHPIQGTAGDGFKAAMAILLPRLAAIGAWCMLAVHDELLAVAPIACAEEARTMVEVGMIEGMSRYVTAVPIVVEAKIVSNWAEAM